MYFCLNSKLNMNKACSVFLLFVSSFSSKLQYSQHLVPKKVKWNSNLFFRRIARGSSEIVLESNKVFAWYKTPQKNVQEMKDKTQWILYQAGIGIEFWTLTWHYVALLPLSSTLILHSFSPNKQKHKYT